MDRAISLASSSLGSVSPNPAVGAVIVKNGKIIGEGWTQPPGQAHAEVQALRQAAGDARGAILYSTLEPCPHFGRTPPCTQAIIEAGISELHTAIHDPNPLVNGKGVSLLNQAGILTHVGECEKEASQLIEAYSKFITTAIPFVIAKFATSLDGKIATHTGASKWITGADARAYSHQLRAENDAIMVGINTVVADDPKLTAREMNGKLYERQPLRVIIDSKGRVHPSARLWSQPGQTLIVVSNPDESNTQKLNQIGADVEQIPHDDGTVDLSELLKVLGRRKITSILVEGGGILLGSLFDQGLVDKVVAFIAPVIIGGKAAPSPVAGTGVATMDSVKTLSRVTITPVGQDVAIIGYCEA